MHAWEPGDPRLMSSRSARQLALSEKSVGFALMFGGFRSFAHYREKLRQALMRGREVRLYPERLLEGIRRLAMAILRCVDAAQIKACLGSIGR